MDGVVHSDESFNDTFIGERDFDNAAAGTKTRYVDIVRDALLVCLKA